jgi:peptidoglycan-N-acetylglucosamine deacetylase
MPPVPPIDPHFEKGAATISTHGLAMADRCTRSGNVREPVVLPDLEADPMRLCASRFRTGLVVAALVIGLPAVVAPPLAAAASPGAVPAATPGGSDQPGAKIRKQLKVSIKVEPEVLEVQRSSKRTVALTFDDGPDPAWTPQVLALLRRYRAVATFCMVGENVRAHPELVEQVVDAGMRLCDHSRTHPVSLVPIAEDQQRDEIVGARSDLSDVTKAAVPYFRAPGGNWSPEVIRIATKKKMQPLGWSVDPRDWSLPGAPVIVSRVQAGAQPGAIILMHDGGGPRQQTVTALRTLLPWLVDNGYSFSFPTK